MIHCVQQILEGGKLEYWHSKSITKLNLELPTYLLIFFKHFILMCIFKKRYLCSLSFKWHLGNLCSSYKGWATTVIKQVFFGGFCNFILFMSAQVIVNAQNPSNIPLHSNCCSSVSIWVKMPRKNNGTFDVLNLLFFAAYFGQLRLCRELR